VACLYASPWHGTNEGLTMFVEGTRLKPKTLAEVYSHPISIDGSPKNSRGRQADLSSRMF